MKSKKKNNEENLPMEELERRNERRERNKIAAAKCRQRRVDRINYLTQKTDNLRSIKDKLEEEYLKLQVIEKEYQNLLKTHKCVYKSTNEEENSFSNSLIPISNQNITDDGLLKKDDHLDNSKIKNEQPKKPDRPKTLNIKDNFVAETIKNDELELELNCVDFKYIPNLKSNFNDIKQNTFQNFATPTFKTPIFHFPDLISSNTSIQDSSQYNSNMFKDEINDINTPTIFSFQKYNSNLHTGLTPLTSALPPVYFSEDIKINKDNMSCNTLVSL
ncbi:unnamed protein product [Gordionus sp. m RMFG-2023]|uniref:transcription factor kayak-like n=1 Tax=Gordionus sp. m RMFG-2023 TaxID=3053472 RepID=UPI0030E205EA